jgi:hypothetical protein
LILLLLFLCEAVTTSIAAPTTKIKDGPKELN